MLSRNETKKERDVDIANGRNNGTLGENIAISVVDLRPQDPVLPYHPGCSEMHDDRLRDTFAEFDIRVSPMCTSCVHLLRRDNNMSKGKKKKTEKDTIILSRKIGK